MSPARARSSRTPRRDRRHAPRGGGDDVIAERTIPRIREAAEEAEADAVLVDGLRSQVEAERFRDAFGDDFKLVAIEAPFEVRAERLGERGRDQSDVDLEALRERDSRELELGLGDTMAEADLQIDNTGSLEEFRDKVRDVLGVLGEAGKLDVTGDGETDATGGDATTNADDPELEPDQ